jgi:hypothetical protein
MVLERAKSFRPRPCPHFFIEFQEGAKVLEVAQDGFQNMPPRCGLRIFGFGVPQGCRAYGAGEGFGRPCRAFRVPGLGTQDGARSLALPWAIFVCSVGTEGCRGGGAVRALSRQGKMARSATVMRHAERQR